MTDVENKRSRFEHLVFTAHFISTIERTGLGGPLTFMPNPDKRISKADLLARDGEGYAREDISAMWFGWQKAMEEMRKTS
jgi:hypothetical protein